MKAKVVARFLIMPLLIVLVMSGCGSGPVTVETTKAAETTAAAETTKAAETTAAAETTVAETTAAETAAEATEPNLDTKYDLQIYVSTSSEWNANAKVKVDMEKAFNINIIPIFRPDQSAYDWYTTKIMAGDQMDYFTGYFHWPQYQEYVSQGLIIPLDKKMIVDNMPLTQKFYAKYASMVGGDIYKWYDRDGKIYAIPNIYPEQGTRNVLGFRTDWLKKVGLSAPTTPEEMDKVLQAFTEQDPDGNGKNDTYGYTCANWFQFAFSFITGAYDSYLGLWYMGNDGKLTYGSVAPGLKDGLTWLQKWYKAGWIDPEMLTSGDWGSYFGKINSGKAGCTIMNYHMFLFEDQPGAGQFIYNVKQNTPGAGFTITSGLKGPNGGSGLLQFEPLDYAGIMFTASMEGQEGKLQRYMQFFDQISGNVDWLRKISWGYEGETYKYSSKDGATWLPPYDTMADNAEVKRKLASEYGVGDLGSLKFVNELFLQDIDNVRAASWNAKLTDWDKFGMTVANNGKHTVMNRVPGPFPVLETYKESLTVLEQTYISEIIKGDRPVSDFDEYVKKWYDEGGQKVYDEAVALYAKYYK